MVTLIPTSTINKDMDTLNQDMDTTQSMGHLTMLLDTMQVMLLVTMDFLMLFPLDMGPVMELLNLSWEADSGTGMATDTDMDILVIISSVFLPHRRMKMIECHNMIPSTFTRTEFILFI